MKYVLIPLVFLVCIVSTAKGELSSKQEQAYQILTIVEDLYQEASYYQGSNYTSYKEFVKDVKKIVENKLTHIDNPELLARVAVITKAICAGDAEYVKFDEVFYQAYRACIRKLAEKPSQENHRALKYIQQHLYLDGGESLSFKQVMRRFEQQLEQMGEHVSQ